MFHQAIENGQILSAGNRQEVCESIVRDEGIMVANCFAWCGGFTGAEPGHQDCEAGEMDS